MGSLRTRARRPLLHPDLFAVGRYASVLRWNIRLPADCIPNTGDIMIFRIPPPIIVVIAAVLTWASARYTAAAILFPGQELLAVFRAVAGFVINALGVTGLRRTDTT